MQRSSKLKGVYASPAAVVAAPDYAGRLVGSHGVNSFVLRTGFNPSKVDPDLNAAVGIVRNLGAEVVLLVGTWWGEGLSGDHLVMRPTVHLLDYDADLAHESRWSMLTPGQETHSVIARQLADLSEQFQPDAICLTHARFKHAADLNSLFEIGSGSHFSSILADAGLTMEDLHMAVTTMKGSLGRLSTADLDAMIGEGQPERLLDQLAESNVSSRWFELRRRLILNSLSDLRLVVADVDTSIRFGCNAVGPLFSRLSGQDYADLLRTVQFVQPLFGYTRWHVLQPLVVWGQFLRTFVADLDESFSRRFACRLFGLPEGLLERHPLNLLGSDEGPANLIREVVHCQGALLAKVAGKHLPLCQPILRGQDWPDELISELAEKLGEEEIGGVFFQGSAHLARPVPGEGWA